MIKKINPIQPVEAPKKVFRGKNKQGAPSGAGRDNFEVSSFARELATAVNDLKKVPEIRTEKVQAFARQIEEGTYTPRLSVVATMLMGARESFSSEES